MKTYLPYSLILAAAATGMAFGAETAYTTPVGYSSKALAPGFNMAGLTLQTPTLAAGNFSGVSVPVPNTTLLTDLGATFTPVVGGRLYVLEITSGALINSIQEVLAVNITTDTITVTQDLVALGLVVGDTYRLRIAPTLEDIFTEVPLASGGVLASALSVGSSDVIWLPDGAGGFEKYYLRTSGLGVSKFRSTPANVEVANVPVVYVDGMIIEKKFADPATLTVSGEVKTQGSNSSIAFGFNLASIVAPVGLNLDNAGLQDDVFPALSAGAADLVWVQQPDNSFVKYFLRTNGFWRVEGAAVSLTQAEAQAVTLPNALLIEKKNPGTSPLSLNVPASFSGL